jgi:hypothetical protein
MVSAELPWIPAFAGMTTLTYLIADVIIIFDSLAIKINLNSFLTMSIMKLEEAIWADKITIP